MASKKSLINKRIGFMQGRLIPSEKKECIQYFPDKNWKKEILIAKKNNFSVMEWTVNFENIKKNPLFKKKFTAVLILFCVDVPNILVLASKGK